MTSSKSGRVPPTTILGGRVLPVDLLHEASNRLGIASVLLAIGFFLSWTAAPAEAQPQGTFPVLDVAAMSAMAISMIVFYLSRKLRDDPPTLQNVGLAYEIVYCFAIAISEQWLPWPPDHLVRGISWVSLVLVTF